MNSSLCMYFLFIIHHVPKSVHDPLTGMIKGTEVVIKKNDPLE